MNYQYFGLPLHTKVHPSLAGGFLEQRWLAGYPLLPPYACGAAMEAPALSASEQFAAQGQEQARRQLTGRRSFIVRCTL